MKKKIILIAMLQVVSSILILNIARNTREPSRPYAEAGKPKTKSDDLKREGCHKQREYEVFIPAYSKLSSISTLPGPFTFLDGSKVDSREDWNYRRAEIARLAQKFEYGQKPCTDYSATHGSINGDTLTVSINQKGQKITFNCRILYPENGEGPYPAMIGIGRSFLDNQQLHEMGVAVINFPNDRIAQQKNTGSRGKGKFYSLFGTDHSAGALMAWSWGVSRLIDALEKTPGANIDPTRLGVTGCSRNGKGALAAGAFDERIALTIPQESGAGGAASWRVSDDQGSHVQRLRQIVEENCWFRKDFAQFSTSVDKLPFDQHEIMGLCAPRGLLVLENTDIEWLGSVSTWTAAHAAHSIWEALGQSENMGFSQVGHAGSHCVLPESQKPEVKAFVRKFLLGNDNVNTNTMRTDGNLSLDKEKWMNWNVPSL